MVTQTRKKQSTKSNGARKKPKVPLSSNKTKPPSNKAKPVSHKTKKVELKKTNPNDSVMPYKFEPYQPLKGEPYMGDKQLQHFREILETWKRDLKKEVDNTITEMKGASVLADPNDRATEEEIFALKLRTRDRERKLIHKIEEALQLIDDKEYGYCESCGVEIGIRRLEARPTAFLCIDCKTLDEIRERNMQ